MAAYQNQDYMVQSSEQASEVRKHYQTFGVAVILPVVQSAITGLLVGICAGVYCWLLDYVYPVRAGLAAWALVQCVSWLILLNRWLGLVWRLEQALGLDLSGDGFVGEPEPEIVRIELRSEDKKQAQFADLPVGIDKLSALSKGLLDGATFSEASWTGAGALFSRSEFRQIRDVFLSRQWVSWRNPDAVGQGLEFTGAGRAVIRHFASMAASSSPTLRERSS